jgi:hypothetical protein
MISCVRFKGVGCQDVTPQNPLAGSQNTRRRRVVHLLLRHNTDVNAVALCEDSSLGPLRSWSELVSTHNRTTAKPPAAYCLEAGTSSRGREATA